MRQNYSKLLGIYLISGLGFQTLQTADASMEHKKSIKTHYRKSIKNTRKKITPYHIRNRKSQLQPVIYNTDSNNTNAADSSEEKRSEQGMASWYGTRLNKHKTSSGERLDNQKLTAAHPTLPLGTKVLVRSEDTGNSVIVTVNDRGPFVGNRVIDLSRAAAAKIGMIRSGTAYVTITPLTEAEVAEAPE